MMTNWQDFLGGLTMNKKIEDIMAGFEPSLIAGFEASLIEGMLKKNFGYKGKIDDLIVDNEDIVVRLYNNEGFDVSIVRKGSFELKHIVVQNYIGNKNGQPIVELTDRHRQLSLIGYRVEDEDG